MAKPSRRIAVSSSTTTSTSVFVNEVSLWRFDRPQDIEGLLRRQVGQNGPAGRRAEGRQACAHRHVDRDDMEAREADDPHHVDAVELREVDRFLARDMRFLEKGDGVVDGGFALQVGETELQDLRRDLVALELVLAQVSQRLKSRREPLRAALVQAGCGGDLRESQRPPRRVESVQHAQALLERTDE